MFLNRRDGGEGVEKTEAFNMSCTLCAFSVPSAVNKLKSSDLDKVKIRLGVENAHNSSLLPLKKRERLAESNSQNQS